MAKNLKLNIKNTQIAEAISLGGIKEKLAKKKAGEEIESSTTSKAPAAAKPKVEEAEIPKEETPRIRARSKSAFAESSATETAEQRMESNIPEASESSTATEKQQSFAFTAEEPSPKFRTSAQLRKDIFGDEESKETSVQKEKEGTKVSTIEKTDKIDLKEKKEEVVSPKETTPTPPPVKEEKIKEEVAASPAPVQRQSFFSNERPRAPSHQPPREALPPRDKLGPTGRHVKDLIKPKPAPILPSQVKSPARDLSSPQARKTTGAPLPKEGVDQKLRTKPKEGEEIVKEAVVEEKGIKTKFKEFRDVKPSKKPDTTRTFDARDRQGLRTPDDDKEWRRRRTKAARPQQEDITIRPSSLSVRTPISIKDLASEMKLKASQLIAKLFLQGLIVTLNDLLDDETTIQLLGHEFGCEITIDRREEKRIQITDRSIKEELSQISTDDLIVRPPVVAFMGHVDHGKTSLIDMIRKSNRAAGEAGAITQHIGAFRCHTAVGDIAILDTPGHEAFSSMRARGADVTDIVVLVVAGDEGIRQQTLEAIQHARAAKVTIVVAINKSDKPNYNTELVYRQLAEIDLLPEVWGGQTITVNCSALTGDGVKELLEMLALQAEILELRANPHMRARGSVLESEMHKGLGSVATVLVQNGTLRRGDALVFGHLWGRVKTMHNEFGQELQEAGPSTPVEITGLSGLPEAGQEFIVVKNEREAREIAEVRQEGVRQSSLLMQQKKKISVENLFQQATPSSGKKILNLILRADVQGSLEALKVALMKIESTKAELNIIFAGVGEVSESDVQLASTSKAVILGFHTQIENHAEAILKQLGIQVRLHDIIYHAIDDVKVLLAGLLEKIAQENEKGKAIVKATFRSSHTGVIAGCQVTEGTITRNNYVRVKRGQNIVWKGTISSLKRVKEDVREVQKGLECGILLNNFSEIQEGDILEAYEITYISQEL